MQTFFALLRQLLRVRYRVHTSGGHLLRADETYLFLPNHTALIDPPLVFSQLGSRICVHPLVVETFYNAPVLHHIFKAIGAISIRDGAAGEMTSDDLTTSTTAILDALSRRESVVVYPAGGLKKQATESIIGKKTAYELLRQLPPHVRVIIVKTNGLRGSSFSKAWNGTTPGIGYLAGKALRTLVANLIFFVPKRPVDITYTDVTKHAREMATKGADACNTRLESLYNAQGPESLEYIPYYFYYNDVEHKTLPTEIAGSTASLHQTNDYSALEYPPEILEKIATSLRTIKPEYTGEITPTTNIILDVHCDSLDAAELKSVIQSAYPHASNPPLLDLKVVGDYIVMAMGHSPHVETLKPCQREIGDATTARVMLRDVVADFSPTDTIPGLIKRMLTTNPQSSFCYDTMRGLQSKHDYTIKAFLIADIIKQYPGQHIGIMLPATTATSLLITASYLAGKIPVMFNWTLGQKAFDHCFHHAPISAILTSKAFFQKIHAPYLDGYPMVFLEDLLHELSLMQKVTALIKSRYFPLPHTIPPEAVILFTSGSEALPKAVHITHQNIIQNIKGAVGLLDVALHDIFLGFLPPFHSFGFTVNTILPLITGLRVAYSPDPNDSKTLANLVEHTQATGFSSTPTFLSKIMRAASASQLRSLSFVISGAEKCPELVFDTLRTMAPHCMVIEGYGITECSPIISANPFHHIKPGTVGVPILGIEVRILDIESMQDMAAGHEGMIYVAGPSVFGGYADPTISSPFVEHNGKQYYRTGDLGFLDADGYLVITGRLKRFLKIAGEMISLPFVETVLLEGFGGGNSGGDAHAGSIGNGGSSDGALPLAVEGVEHDNGTATIVMFWAGDAASMPSVETVNAYLREHGVSNLVHIHDVRTIDAIPLLGTGKVDYKVLKGMLVT